MTDGCDNSKADDRQQRLDEVLAELLRTIDTGEAVDAAAGVPLPERVQWIVDVDPLGML